MCYNGRVKEYTRGEGAIPRLLLCTERGRRIIEQRIMYGDCLELMRDIPDKSIDMILCDPPYGIDYQSCRIKDKQKRKSKIANDKKPFVDFIPHIERILKPTAAVLIFTRWDVQQQFIDKMKECNMSPRGVIIWDKVAHGMGDLKRAPASRCESIICYTGEKFTFPDKRPVDIIRYNRVPACKLQHPNEKPVCLLEILIKQYSRNGDTVLDMCMGSGATGVACVNTRRNFIGMELDYKYFEIAEQRIQAAKNI